MSLFSNKKIFWLLSLILLAIPTFSTLLRPGYFPMHDDMQAMRLLQMDKCIKDGQVPCRWVPDMGYGYGYPQFIFYSPLPYYFMEVFHLLGFSILTSVKIVMALGFILAALSMFLLGSTLWGHWGGLLSAVLYLYAPYRASDLYSRGAVAEYLAFIFLPLIFWSIYRFVHLPKKKYLIFLSLSYAGLLLTHNITTLAFTPLAAIWTLFLLAYHRRFQLLPKFLLGGLLGIGLAAFYILPVVFEKRFAHLETMISGYFNYLAHFVSFKQLFFSSFWGFGSSELGPFDDLSFTIGYLHWLLPLLAALLSLWFFKKNKHLSFLTLLLAAFFALTSFMSHQKSSFIWSLLPFLKYFQFPWRWLVSATFFASLAAGSLVVHLPAASRKYLVLSLTFLIILLNFSFFRPNRWLEISDTEKFSGASFDRQMTISIFDYLPISAAAPPAAPAPDLPEVILGDASILHYTKGTNWQQGQIEVRSNSATLRLPLYYFPGFKAKVDGHGVPIDYQNQLGLITIDVPRGTHTISARLHNTPLRQISDILTLASIISLCFWIYDAKKN